MKAPLPNRTQVQTWLVPPGQTAEHERPQAWWRVMCLTGLDYFSTLGYQPGIAAVAAGAIGPIATLVLILLTLFGALPVYRRVATESPRGEGSVRMLEKLLPGWPSKLLVLVLLGFAMTDFIITITLSAADAAAHIVENPYMKAFMTQGQLPLTLLMVVLLGAVFLKGFKEAIGIAVVLVSTYLALNVVVIGRGLLDVAQHPEVFSRWQQLISSHQNGWLGAVLIALIVFPKLALGLSGFETGVSVMPQVKGTAEDTPEQPTGRIHNTKKLLTTAALIMSGLLLTSSLVVTLLITPDAVQAGGPANGRALAYLAHRLLGEAFGTVYDISTILILWFAGASAMTGLLNLVPRYLPRYGMSPHWAGAIRPLAIVFTLIGVAITIIFKANVDAQGGAYATGVLVLMSSAAFAVSVSAMKARSGRRFFFIAITLVFLYTTIINVIERPDGLHIAAFFITGIILLSLISRIQRSTELRISQVELNLAAREFVNQSARFGSLPIIAHRPDTLTAADYREKMREARKKIHLPESNAPVIFLEISISNASDFEGNLEVHGKAVGSHHVLRAQAPAVPNAIASLLLHLRDITGVLPDAYFGWDEKSPLENAASFFFFGEGDIAPLTREILRKAESDPEKRPLIHVGG